VGAKKSKLTSQKQSNKNQGRDP